MSIVDNLGAVKLQYWYVLYVWERCSKTALNPELVLFVGPSVAHQMASDGPECRGCRTLSQLCVLGCLFTQQGVNVSQVN